MSNSSSSSYCEIQAIQYLEHVSKIVWGGGNKTYSFRDNALVVEMLAYSFHELHLLFRSQSRDCAFDNTAERDLIDRNEAVVVHVCEETHDELAIHSVRNTTMARNRIAEVLDFEGPLKSGSEEATKWSDERCESREN